MSSPTTRYAPRVLTATDGVDLAVYEAGTPGQPTVVLIHGYPDDHRVWDGVVELLADRFHVVSYDLRGAGKSGMPKGTAGFGISQLVDDLDTVLSVATPQGAHILAHDWGSIFAWDAVADPRFENRIHSFTSISGPSLDMLAVWMRRFRRHPRAVAAQLRMQAYSIAFQVPAVPEFFARRGLVSRVVAASSTAGEPFGAAHTVSMTNSIDGIGLYRANLVRRLLLPRPRTTAIPVQVLAPVDEVNISVAAQTEAPVPFATNLRVLEIEGNHWVIAQRPEVVAEHFVDFVAGLVVST